MGEFAKELLSSPEALWLFVLLSPWLAMLGYIAYLLRTKQPGVVAGLTLAEAAEMKVQLALLRETSAALSAIRKSQQFMAGEVSIVKERLARVEATCIERANMERRKKEP